MANLRNETVFVTSQEKTQNRDKILGTSRG